MNELKLLCVALGIEADEAFARRFEGLGGARGLMATGADVLDLRPAQRRRLEAILELAAALAAPTALPDAIRGPEDVVAWLAPKITHALQESFWVVMLDARGRPIAREEVARGTLTACLVHPREVFAPAIRRRAASIVLVHNHPSGDVEPSDEDVALTERLTELGVLVGIPVVDHVVVGGGRFRSLGGPQTPLSSARDSRVVGLDRSASG